MFERFTPSARQVIIHAQQASLELKHNRIGEEHLLLGLISTEDGVAAHVLERLGATHDGMRAEVVRRVGEGEGAPAGQIPFTPEAKRMLERSMKEALGARDEHIGTKHLLLSAAQDEDGIAPPILQKFGISAERIRNEIPRLPAPAADLPERRRGRHVHLDVEDSVNVGLTPRARRILQCAAEQAFQEGRPEVAPGDLLEPLMLDETIASVLSHLGVDLDALLERLRATGWSEPET